MKIVALWGDKDLVGGIFLGGERLFQALTDDEILMK